MNFAAFDLDDTLNLLREGVCESMRRRGFLIRANEMHCYDWSTLFGEAAPGLLEVLMQDRLLETAEPDVPAIDAVRQILKDGVHVEVWTARGWHPDGYGITRRYLDRVGLQRAGIRLVGLNESKVRCLPVCVSRTGTRAHKPDLYVDDAPHHIDALLRAGVRGARLLRRPWSPDGHGLPVCISVSEAVSDLYGRRAA